MSLPGDFAHIKVEEFDDLARYVQANWTPGEPGEIYEEEHWKVDTIQHPWVLHHCNGWAVALGPRSRDRTTCNSCDAAVPANVLAIFLAVGL